LPSWREWKKPAASKTGNPASAAKLLCSKTNSLLPMKKSTAGSRTDSQHLEAQVKKRIQKYQKAKQCSACESNPSTLAQ